MALEHRSGYADVRNISAAVQVAKKLGFQFLLLDLVSIDNSLRGPALLESVVSFAYLYEKLPVIAAYDYADIDPQSWHQVPRRPWIAHEIRIYLRNRTRVYYAAYLPDQGATHFRNIVERIWITPYSISILYALLDENGMTDVSDFRFIMHGHAEILEAAYQILSRNDYLLATALLNQQEASTSRINPDQDVTLAAFDRFSFGPEAHGVARELVRTIFLDGKKVGAWSTDDGGNFGPRMKLYVDSDADRTILSALGLPADVYETLAAQYRARRREFRAASVGERASYEVCLVDGDEVTIVAPRDSALMPRLPQD